MGEFFHAVRVFGDHLASVEWTYLGLALAFHFSRLVLRAVAWRTILRAAYPDRPVPFTSTFGAYVAGVGINSILPARSGDLVKLYLIKHRVPDSTYATLAPTLVVETLLDFVIGSCLIIWVLSIGVLPAYRGMGVGSALLLQALRGFQRMGLRRAILEVTAENERAIQLYWRLGFRRTKTIYKAVAPFAGFGFVS